MKTPKKVSPRKMQKMESMTPKPPKVKWKDKTKAQKKAAVADTAMILAAPIAIGVAKLRGKQLDKTQKTKGKPILNLKRKR